MKKTLALFIILAAILSCKQKSQDADFDSFKNNFIEKYWKIYPSYATYMGYHNYDSLLYIFDEKQQKLELEFIKKELKSLKNFDIKSLSALNVIDYKLIENQLNSDKFRIEELQSYQWNPSDYNVGEGFAVILNGAHASLQERMEIIEKRLPQVTVYYANAKNRIKSPTIEHTQLAIDQNEGTLSIFTSEIPDSLKVLQLTEDQKTAFNAKLKTASAAIQDYIQWLKDTPNPTPRSFRLGKDLYAKKFNFDIQSTFTSAQLLDSAKARKEFLHREMEVLTDKLWPKYFGTKEKPQDPLAKIRMMIDTISIQHVQPADFQAEIERTLPELTEFVRKKDLLYMDPDKPLAVRREPAYMAGVAGASMSSPGPYEKNGKSYYNVGSLEGWEPQRAESYLREYNDYILQILNIHEAIPGHYVQLVYSNKAPSIIKSVFQNGSMIEGWAVYTEKLMIESGYRESQEMWLMYYKWSMRATCNTILDIAVHTENMSQEQAMDLLVNQAFQQQAEAEGKWKRATLTQVQLTSYYNGFKEICDLRDDYMKSKGDKYKVKEFNETFLSYGSSPVKYVREQMM